MPNLSPRPSDRRTSMEQRAYPRFEVNARCHFVGFPSDAAEGITENISRGGVLLRLKLRGSMAALPVIGEILTVDIELPANLRFGQKYLRCRGSVVRVSNSRQSLLRVALSVSQMEFKDKLGASVDKAVNGKALERFFVER